MNRPGDRVGPFELTELIASRPLANLWKAQRADGTGREPRTVVVRVAHHTMDSRAMTELRKEYDALRGIDDPRVRKVHGFFAGFGALALEFVDGVSLAGLLEKSTAAGEPLDLPTVVDVGVELISALRVVHDASVVHGRVCADTVRVRPDGSVVLTDFALPVERLVVVPPELKTGHTALATTDQWLVGALLVHLVTGQPLLGGSLGDPADGRRDVRPWVAAVSGRCAALGRVIGKMLARDARDRYSDESMLLRDLLATLRSLEGLPDREALARRYRVPSAAAAAPPLMPPPTPRLAPAPARRDVQLRPLPAPGRVDLAPTLPPELGGADAFDAPQPTEVVRRDSGFDAPQPTVVDAPRAAAAPPSASLRLPAASAASLAAPTPAAAAAPARPVPMAVPARPGPALAPGPRLGAGSDQPATDLPAFDPTPPPTPRPILLAPMVPGGAEAPRRAPPPSITPLGPRALPAPVPSPPRSGAAPGATPTPASATTLSEEPTPVGLPRIPIRRPGGGDAPPTDLVGGEDPSPAPVLRPPARAFTPTASDLVEAVQDEAAPPETPDVVRSLSPTPDAGPSGPAANPRLIPDWFAAFALVLLLAVGLWAVVSRFF